MLKDLLFCLFLDLLFRKAHLLLFNIISRGNNQAVWDKLKGKYVVVTGATGDIGKELCRNLVGRDVKLILIGRDEYKLNLLKDELSSTLSCLVFVVDFSMENDFSFLDDYNDIGLLINNAGTLGRGPSLYLEEDDEPLLNVNIRSTTRITRRVLQKMIEGRFGYILNIGSVCSALPFPYLSSYAASKAFLKTWSFSLHYEMKRFNIEVEYVDLAYVATKMTKLRPVVGLIPSKREIAGCILKSFGFTKHLVPYAPHFILIYLISFIPEFVLGRLIEWGHRVFRLDGKHKNRSIRKIKALRKGRKDA